MAEFQRRAGTVLPKTFTMTVAGKLALKLVPDRKEKLPVEIGTSDAGVLNVVGVAHREKANFMLFSLEALKLGTASLHAGTDPAKPVAGPVAITVRARTVLPDKDSEEGMFVRLFLAECWTPSMQGYSAADAETAMTWMKKVVRNRLVRRSATVGSAGARTVFDVVRARNQFEGFGKYPALSERITKNLEKYVSIANDDSHAERDAYRQFIDTAMKVAGVEATDPQLANLVFWKTTGTPKPAPGAVEFRELMGNTFYTLAP